MERKARKCAKKRKMAPATKKSITETFTECKKREKIEKNRLQ